MEKVALPRGIQEISRKNKDGTPVTKYRVQINRKNFKQDRLFESLDEAVEFLNASKSATGQKQIHLLEEQQKTELKIIQDFISNPTIEAYIKSYIETYVDPRFADCDPKTAEGKIKLRNKASIIGFYSTIKKTIINERSDENFPISKLIYKHYDGKKAFGEFKPKQITEIEINEYIKARRKAGIKPISIQREITAISNLFKKLKYLDPDLKSIPNPTRDYDRDLLKTSGGMISKKVHRITDEDKKKFFELLDNYPNPELGWISKLMLFTAMRRTEAVLLKWSQIFEKHIYLEHTKSGKPRIVYLTPEAKELLNSIPKKEGQDRLFTYSVLGYDSNFYRVMEDNNLKHIKIHGLRKEAISGFIERIGANNSLLISEFLGFASVRKIEEHIETQIPAGLSTQEELLRSVGHSNPAITQNHYFSLKK